ncbi:FAD-binding oxidoreductase [Oceanobacter mangrovi]|uniref:FAD-binding oxidoreductase n=1 Tax=Oceanobacter mangrovi TaxID=2862510 RepID=UPI001C8DDECF|nr:FAD-dependent oxidoreductase [Oceanobacter mangrovi]
MTNKIPQDSSTTTNPIPELQRLGVLATYALSVRNARQFRHHMLDNGFPVERLLTPLDTRESNLPGLAGLTHYQTETLIFNTRYQYQPFAIVMCSSTDEVVLAYNTAVRFNLPVRIRAGGHDHAGECSGDNVVLIDVTGLRKFDIDDDGIATIGAGYRFYQLTPLLAKHDRMIAHGTCATVGLAGYIQGGGWGPWTRKYGMGCERLIGATLVLGNGTVVEVSEESHPELLWALRGGGGMSYGIVTELKMQTFPLPAEIHRFELEWNIPAKTSAGPDCTPQQDVTTLTLLKNWEAVIQSDQTSQLLGTNLKINAIPAPAGDYDLKQLFHNSLMYGYWDGDQNTLEAFIASQFSNTPPSRVQIHKAGGADSTVKYDHSLMGNWDRNSLADASAEQGHIAFAAVGGTPFVPDYDAPAPHKLTSRLVSAGGLGDGDDAEQGYLQLLQTLTSPLLQLNNSASGLYSYVTLGAIDGDFYRNQQQLSEMAFPYRRCQYTIQYQTWWNESLRLKIEQQNNDVYVDTNRAMDWIDACRDAEIQGTYGAFISFKDASIPTEVYFDSSYQRLVQIKQEYVEDKDNHLRTRKTII